MFISSSHNIKSKIIIINKRILKKMKENGFAFDAFGQWSEHFRS
jgi:hypothetical protein